MTSAAVVSAALRKAGIQTLGSGTSRMREGIRVSRSYPRGTVSVAVDLDGPRAAARLADDVDATLTGLGFTVERNPLDACLMTVERAS